jgi:SAM-dependent methyltransferase
LRVQTALVSVLDDEALTPFENTFAVVLAAALLHHLAGTTRRASMSDAMHGLSNAMRMVRPGGTLVVLKPVYRPRAGSAALFWAKRATTSMTEQRISIFGYWNNIGAPVVSFYSPQRVLEMVKALGGELVGTQSTPERVGWGSKLMRKDNLTVIAAKPAAANDGS